MRRSRGSAAPGVFLQGPFRSGAHHRRIRTGVPLLGAVPPRGAPVELSDYLRAMGKRLLILLLVPVIAGGVAFTLLSRQPTRFQARATVRLPVPGEAATSVISQANSDFTEALRSDAVMAKTAE